MGLTRDELVARLIRAGELEVSGGDQAEIDSYFDSSWRICTSRMKCDSGYSLGRSFSTVKYQRDLSGNTVRLGRAELIDLAVDWEHYGTSALGRTQAIGAAVAHLQYDGLIAPSARWACDNVMLFFLIRSRSMRIWWCARRGKSIGEDG